MTSPLRQHNNLPGVDRWRLASDRAARYAVLAMPRLPVIACLLLAGSLFSALNPAAAAELRLTPHAIGGSQSHIWRYTSPGTELPFQRSQWAQAIWNDGACWSQCGSYCAWAMDGCLKTGPQGQCLLYTDACDRYCQRSCRSASGPFVPLE
jgi:hypothetical protein